MRAIEEIEGFLRDISLEDFEGDVKAIRAVTMDFIVIGEAAKHLPLDVRKNYPQIPWSRVVGMRNILTHDYPETNVEIIWKTAKKRLPILKEVAEDLLKQK